MTTYVHLLGGRSLDTVYGLLNQNGTNIDEAKADCVGQGSCKRNLVLNTPLSIMLMGTKLMRDLFLRNSRFGVRILIFRELINLYAKLARPMGKQP